MTVSPGVRESAPTAPPAPSHESKPADDPGSAGLDPPRHGTPSAAQGVGLGKWLVLWVLVFGAVSAAFCGVSAVIVAREQGNDDRLTDSGEASHLEAAVVSLRTNIGELVGQLDLLANLPASRSYAAGASPGVLERIAGGYVALMEAFPIYDQVRFLDQSGRELVRINNTPAGPVQVPDAELQDKSERPYFRDTMALAPGLTYISPFDLNIEHGVIELPEKPMVRLAQSLRDADGHQVGVIVTNLRGQVLLDRFRTLMHGAAGAPMLLDESGGVLTGPIPGDAFAFQRDPARTFAKAFPQVWSAMTKAQRGVVSTPSGTFVFRAFTPVLSDDTHRLWPVRRWVAVSWQAVDRTQLGPRVMARMVRAPWFIPGLLASLVGSGVLTLLFLSRQNAHGAFRRTLGEMRSITDAVAEGVLLLDSDGRIQFANPEACALLGRDPAELLGQDAHSTIHSGSREAAADCPILQALHNGQRRQLPDETLWRADGRPVPVSISVAPAFADDRRIGLVLAFHDISHQKRTMAELAESNRRLADLAAHDALTGLANRRSLDLAAARVWNTSRAHGEAVAVVMVDVDFFKRYNDAFGHQAGDLVLQQVAATLQQEARRPRDIAGRYGGEEFILVLPGADTEGARMIAEDCRRRLEALALPQAEPGQVVTISCGVAATTPRNSGSLVELIAAADDALYSAKRQGRNRVVCAD